MPTAIWVQNDIEQGAEYAMVFGKEPQRSAKKEPIFEDFFFVISRLPFVARRVKEGARQPERVGPLLV